MFAKTLVFLTAVLGTTVLGEADKYEQQGGTTYKSTFTAYGSGDQNNSGNCVKKQACGFYFKPGYTAAASQNLYGAGPGDGAGPACGKCYKLTAEKDSSGNSLSDSGKSIVVRIDNLCPASGNSVCSMSSLQDTNSYGANVNFDLCMDSGASDALFGSSGVGLAQGTAELVDCSDWHGTQIGHKYGTRSLLFEA